MSSPCGNGGDHRLMMSSRNPDNWSVFCSLSLGPRWLPVPDVSGSLFEKHRVRSLPTFLWVHRFAGIATVGWRWPLPRRRGELVGHCWD